MAAANGWVWVFVLSFWGFASQTRPLLFSCYGSSADPIEVNDKFSISLNEGLGLTKAIIHPYVNSFLDSFIEERGSATHSSASFSNTATICKVPPFPTAGPSIPGQHRVSSY